MDKNAATSASLVADGRRLGLEPGDTVMMHASMRAVGPILGGPDVLIDALREVIGPDGTLMMYAGCQPPYDHIGRGGFDDENLAFIEANLPQFETASSRADRDHGVLAEFLRTYPGTVCSDNPPARMAALGGRSVALTADHPLNYGFGPGSPLAKLCETGGKVMLIGSDHDSVTLLHYAEHLAPIPNKRILRLKLPIAGKGWVDIEEYDTTSKGIVDWPDRFFATIVDDFLVSEGIAAGRLGRAETVVLDAQALVDHALPMMVKEAAT
ncbi:MAG: aminoglycoside 3-N-acetyltransferase [Pseudomonadota bacterium]